MAKESFKEHWGYLQEDLKIFDVLTRKPENDQIIVYPFCAVIAIMGVIGIFSIHLLGYFWISMFGYVGPQV